MSKLAVLNDNYFLVAAAARDRFHRESRAHRLAENTNFLSIRARREIKVGLTKMCMTKLHPPV